MIEWVLIMFVPILYILVFLFWIGNSLANIATGIKIMEQRVRNIKRGWVKRRLTKSQQKKFYDFLIELRERKSKNEHLLSRL